MKVEVIKNEEQEITYPCLMVHKANESLILLFSRPNTATVIHSSQVYEIGEHSTEWKESHFKLFTGKLQLSNE